MTHLRQLLFLVVVLVSCVLLLASKEVTKKTDINDNRGNSPFFLQDPYDSMCLGPKGFTICDESTLWILTKRKGKKTYSLVNLLSASNKGICLERKKKFFGLWDTSNVGLGSCKSSGAKEWEFEFLDQVHVKLSSKGQCLVRGKKTYKNSMSLQDCKKGDFLPLVYHTTAVHENGFYFKSADGKCFDGSKFRACDGTGSAKLLWGVGIRYIWGEARRYFFGFHVQERNTCLVSSGSKVEKGSCNDASAVHWDMSNGQLMTGSGKHCVARKQDNSAVLAHCNEASEYLGMDLPSLYTDEQLEELLKSPDLTNEEKRILMESAKQKTKLNSM